MRHVMEEKYWEGALFLVAVVAFWLAVLLGWI